MWGKTSFAFRNSIFDSNVPNNICTLNGTSIIFKGWSDIAQGAGSLDLAAGTTVDNMGGNISTDPLFVDPANHDFHLQAGSPCIDTGDPALFDPDGSVTDMGYYCFTSPFTLEMTYPGGGESFAMGDTIHITWIATGFVDYSELYYSTDDGANWTLIDTTQGAHADLYWKIPYVIGDYLLKLVVWDEAENSLFVVSDAPFSVTAMHLSQYVRPGWDLISIPLVQGNMHKDAVLGDDFDGQWSLYGFEPDQGHTVVDTMRVGKGYFLGIHDGGTMDVVGIPNLDDDYTFHLARSWNVLGNPFCVPTPLASGTVVWTHNGEVRHYTFDQAVDSVVLSPVGYNFFDDRPAASNIWPYLNNYRSCDTLKNWHGYWYMCMKDSVELTLPNPEAEPPARDNDRVVTPDDWRLDLIAASDSAGDVAGIGANKCATNGFNNRFDHFEPPRRDVDNWVRLYFNHEEWNNPYATKFDRDVRQPLLTGETAEWTLTVECAPAGEMYLFWQDIMEITPTMNSYTLIDEENDVALDMRVDYVYRFQCDGIKELKIRVKSNLEAINNRPVVATGYGLTNIYPNPFNARTSIAFDVAGAQRVTLSVFDINGRKVADLFDGIAPAGTHTLNWNAERLNSGIYFVRFATPGLMQTRRMVLVK